MECVKHKGSSIVSVCITCNNTLVCVDCITDKLHKGHLFEKPNAIAKDIKTKLKQKEVESCKFEASLESDLNEIRALKTQQYDKKKERVKSIKTQREALINAVNELADTLISKYEHQTQKNWMKLQDTVDGISKKLENVRQYKNEVARILEEQDDLTVVQDSGNLRDVDEQRNPYPRLADIEFNQGKVNTYQLKIMFGCTTAEMDELTTLSMDKGSDFVGIVLPQSRDLVLESTFKLPRSKYVSVMCNDFNGKTWVKGYGARKLTLIDNHGHVAKTVTFVSGVKSMTTLNDNTLLVCGFEDRDIKKVLLSNGTITSVFSTGKLHPVYVCTTNSGDIYVTLTDKNDSNTTANCERVLIRYSQKGQEKGRAQYDKRGDPLFVLPYRVRICNTGDVIGVTNGIDEHNNHLVLLNKDFTLRLRYLGNGNVMSREEKFDTTTYIPERRYAMNDFIFDSYDNIIICEAYSKSVQLLSKDCVPISTLIPTQEYMPTSLTMNVDRMWVGFQDGTVNIHQFK